MTLFNRLSKGNFIKTLIVLSMAGYLGVCAVAQVPSSGNTHHPSMSDVSSVSTLQADGSSRSRTALTLDEEGWHTWKIDAVKNAPSWCCNNWRGKKMVSAHCELDSRSYGFSRRSKDAVTDEMQIYVKVIEGRTDSIRTYSADCTAVSQSEVIDHGKVASSTSLDWLEKQLGANEDIAGDALAAIAVHASHQAQRLLESSAHPSQSVERRKQAIFWMGQVRAEQSADALSQVMLTDEVEEVREHAVFSISQSNLNNRLSMIERVARNDRSPKIRGQAWFWMSQTSEAQAGQRILAGMQSENNRSVLKQAVFALSQLTGEDAVDGLIRVIEDAGYDRDVRKQALFWMAQSDSGRAVDYLANVLDR